MKYMYHMHEVVLRNPFIIEIKQISFVYSFSIKVNSNVVDVLENLVKLKRANKSYENIFSKCFKTLFIEF